MSKKSEKKGKVIGRPIEYDPKICDEMIKLFSGGLCKKEVAAKLNISRDTFYRWRKKYSEFEDAIADGMDKSEARSVEILRLGALGQIPRFNATGWALYMNNVHGWSKSGQMGEGANIHIDNVNILQHLSSHELSDRINQKLEQLHIIDVNHATELKEQSEREEEYNAYEEIEEGKSNEEEKV